MAYRMGMNANNNPGARVPRNAVRLWQSNATIARFSGETLTLSIRMHVPTATYAMHPADWPQDRTQQIRLHAEATRG